MLVAMIEQMPPYQHHILDHKQRHAASFMDFETCCGRLPNGGVSLIIILTIAGRQRIKGNSTVIFVIVTARQV